MLPGHQGQRSARARAGRPCMRGRAAARNPRQKRGAALNGARAAAA